MNKLTLEKNKKYLLACSYGPDSMALLFLLLKEGYNFDVAIVNYHLRKESDLEVAGLKEYCDKNDLRLFVKDVGEKIVGNIENKCRIIRYNFFKELCDQNGYDALLVAHQQDDHIETYILQKKRQNCPIFYGINEFSTINGMLVARPLLAFSKKELRQICLDNNVPFAVDQSNYDKSFSRNKIRHEIVSILSVKERESYIKKINEDNTKLNAIISSIDESRLSSVDYVLSLDNITQKYALNMQIKKINPSLYLSSDNVGQIIHLLKSEKPNIFSHIKGNIYFIEEYNLFKFIDYKLTKINYSFILSKPGLLDTDYFFLDFSLDATNRNVHDFDYPLTIRNIKSGDYIYIKGYKVSANRLFIDWKMPISIRRVWPIILDKEGNPIYIPRYKKDFKPDSNTNFYVKV